MVEEVKAQRVIYTVAEVEVEGIVDARAATLRKVMSGKLSKHWPMYMPWNKSIL